MKSIMVATDFSERSDRAMRRATLLARQSGAELSLVHVVDNDQPRRIVDSERDVAEQLLREQAFTLRDVDGVNCGARVVLADPFAGIIQAANDGVPDLLVVGPHRRQALRDIFLGTTAERTIRSVARPVLMANAPPVGPYRHVLLATDLSEESRYVANVVTGLDLAPQARMSVLYVFDAPELQLAMSSYVGQGKRGSKFSRIRAEKRRASLRNSLDTSGYLRSSGWCVTTKPQSEMRSLRPRRKASLISLSWQRGEPAWPRHYWAASPKRCCEMQIVTCSRYRPISGTSREFRSDW